MTDMVVIAGTVVPIQPGARETTDVTHLDERAFDTTLLTTVQTEKRAWEAASVLRTKAQALDIKALVANGAHVACSGELFGGAVTCRVIVRERTFQTAMATDGLGYMIVLSFVFLEV